MDAPKGGGQPRPSRRGVRLTLWALLPLLPLLLGAWGAPTRAAEFHVGLVLPYSHPHYFQSTMGSLIALDHVNSRNGIIVGEAASRLPVDFQLTASFHDTFLSEEQGLQALQGAMEAGAVALIGATRSAVSIPIATMSAVLKYPQVSYLSTSPQLSNDKLFGFFQRTVPDDSLSTQVVMKAVKHFGWKKLGLVYVNDAFGSVAAAIIQSASADGGLQLTSAGFTSADRASMAEALSAMNANGIYVIICVLGSLDLPLISMAHEMGLLGAGRVWLSLESDVSKLLEQVTPEEAASLRPGMQGFLRVEPHICGNLDSVEDDAACGDSSAGWATLRDIYNQGQLPTMTPAEMTDFATSEGPGLFQLPLSVFASYSYDALWAVALAVANATSSTGEVEPTMAFRALVKDELRKIHFAGASGHVAFTPSGDRDPSTGMYTLSYLDTSQNNTSSYGWVTVAVTNAALALAAEENVLELSEPVVWAGGGTDVPSDGANCPQGMIFEEETLSCAFHVAFMHPLSISHGVLSASVGTWLALDHVNHRNQSIVPQAADLPEGFRIKVSLVDSILTEQSGFISALTVYDMDVVAVIGAARSTVTTQLAWTVAKKNMPVVSFASSSPVLSDTEEFPLFTRTINTDTELAKGVAGAILKSFGWRRFGVLHTADTYGNGFRNSFYTGCAAVAASMDPPLPASSYEVASAILSEDYSEMVASLQDMRDKGILVLILSGYMSNMPTFLKAARSLGMLGDGRVYVGLDVDYAAVFDEAEYYGLTQADVESYSLLLQGMIRMFYDPLSEEGNKAGLQMLTAMAEEKGTAITPQPFHDGIQTLGGDPETWFSEHFGWSTYTMFSYDAMWAIALGLAQMERDSPGWLNPVECNGQVNCNGPALSAAIQAQSYKSLTGFVDFAEEVDEDGNVKPIGDRLGTSMAMQVKYWNSTLKTWRSAGMVTGAVGFQPGEESIVWPGFSLTLPSDGASCPAGSFFNSSKSDCQQCAPGYYSSTVGKASCLPCDPGAFCIRPGCTGCTLCSSTSYQQQTAQSKCTPCPANTFTVDGGTNPANCVCKPGYYRWDGQKGLECFMCPEGGVCDGGVLAPYPNLGFWGNWSLVQAELESDKLRNSVFRPCANDGRCDNDCLNDTDTLNGTVETLLGLDPADELRLCRSEPDNVCEDRYLGIECHSCTLGYFAMGGKCLACPEYSALFTLTCVLGITGAWYLINRFAAGTYDSVDLLLIYFQNASTISAYHLPWSQNLSGEFRIFWWIQIFNFDVDILRPDCLSTEGYTAWSYGHSFALQLLLPVAVGLGFFTYHSLNRIALASPLTKSGLGRSALLAFGFASTDDGLQAGFDTAIASVFSFLNMVYHTLVAKCLEVFICSDLPDGSSYLSVAPEVTCWEGVHIAYVCLAVVALMVYVAGIPLTFALVLEYGRQHNLFREPRFMRCFGWLYRRYEVKWVHWELIIMARRAFLVVSLVLVSALRGVQVTLGISIVLVFLAMHAHAQPFVSDQLDQLELFSQVSLAGLLCAGIWFGDTDGQRLFPDTWETGVTVLTYLSICSCVVIVASMAWKDVRHQSSERSAGRRMRQAFGNMIDNRRGRNAVASRNLQRRASLVRFVVDALKRGDDSRSAHKSSFTGGLDEAIAKSLKKHKVELHTRLDIEKVQKWLEPTTVCRKQRLNGWLRWRKTNTVGASQDGDSLLPTAAEGEIPLETQLSLVRFARADKWLSATMADDSPVSYYSRTSNARFFSDLINENPFLIDHILWSEKEDMERLQSVITDLREAQFRYTRQGRLAKLVNSTNRGSFLAWLMLADHNQTKVARQALVAIFEANGGREARGQATAEELMSVNTDGKNAVMAVLCSYIPSPERFGMQAAGLYEVGALPGDQTSVMSEADADVSADQRLSGGLNLHHLPGTCPGVADRQERETSVTFEKKEVSGDDAVSQGLHSAHPPLGDSSNRSSTPLAQPTWRTRASRKKRSMWKRAGLDQLDNAIRELAASGENEDEDRYLWEMEQQLRQRCVALEKNGNT